MQSMILIILETKILMNSEVFSLKFIYAVFFLFQCLLFANHTFLKVQLEYKCVRVN